ncbi:MAG: 3'(2'),5'-bisphosphate nucleotidase CysQ [Actinomycetota bacterium]
MTDRSADLARISRALGAAAEVLTRFSPGEVKAIKKDNQDPVTEADLALDHALKESLVRPGEGWLSEETADDRHRLGAERVWVVDPLDGTKEFVQGIPEWCVSVGLVEDGRAVAGGILNPAAGFLSIGGEGLGCTLNGIRMPMAEGLGDRALVLASRTEVGRGEWQRFEGADFRVQAMGSVAFKLARVACGLAHATWSLAPKHEWDVAAGAALVAAAGGEVLGLDGTPLVFNQPSPWLPGLIAFGPGIATTFDLARIVNGSRSHSFLGP